MDAFFTALNWIGLILSLPGLIAFALGLYAWVRGIAPVLYRLGLGLARRKIALLAKGDNVASGRSLLLDPHLFREENLIIVTSPKDLGRAERADVLLVYWEDWKDNIDDILRLKRDHVALVIYALPQTILPEKLKELDSHRYTIVANFRGRLLNDVIVSLIAISGQAS
ncbi:hypothetical protein [Thermogemmatispora tikiterensis]|uniref:Uncharacterized protein n=1 Tax=Thermogemmatispora tikiterensis TaxID=1825093 RepID=A0A328VKI8_9CHLR|nr:hypothetical protein [Thermogemmatispora tikiterensis]RAQ95634.1 hypothetical protein A4R35_08825 [Thermogemmatispora tikiterensis]